MDTLNMRTGGEGEPAILFLHGLGATGAVWAHLTEQVPRRVLVPDLPGHGPSAPLPHYSFETLTTAVARALPGRPRWSSPGTRSAGCSRSSSRPASTTSRSPACWRWA